MFQIFHRFAAQEKFVALFTNCEPFVKSLPEAHKIITHLQFKVIFGKKCQGANSRKCAVPHLAKAKLSPPSFSGWRTRLRGG
jgi:hypothetical protein